jgi:hypothetical protein
MLAGEMKYRKGNIETALLSLRRAIVLDDALAYSDQAPWMQPIRYAPKLVACFLNKDVFNKHRFCSNKILALLLSIPA